ncbi:MAG: T9SS type A sorting domain-containing protein [Bacteroidia bacterium]
MKKLLFATVYLFSLTLKAQVVNVLALGNTTTHYSGDNGLAINAGIYTPQSLACDAVGNLYFVDAGNNRIRKIDTSGIITTITGTGVASHNGDNGLAINASINSPTALTIDKNGNLYFSDNYLGSSVSYIRKIDTQGIITAFAGDSSSTNGNDGIPALQSSFDAIQSIKTDLSGNVFIATGYTVRKINTSGIVNTIVGYGNLASCGSGNGDGGPATSASFDGIGGIAIDSKGNIYIGDRLSYIVRKVDAVTNIITTIAGTRCTYNSYGAFDGAANTVSFDLNINDMICDSSDNLYMCDLGHVYKIDTAGVLTRIAGQGPAMAGGNGPALTTIVGTDFITIDKFNHIYASAGADNVIKKITLCTSVPPTINISAINSATVCTGDSVKLIANGAPNFSWQPWGASMIDTLNAAPLSTIQYTAFGYYSNGCVGQDTFSIHILNGCVWPGDANEDLTVDNTDLLEVGLNYGKIGSARTAFSNAWQGYSCTDWNDTLTNGKNIKYADCNGDGLINLNDTLAIYLNYSTSHNARYARTEEVQSTNLDVSVNFNKNLYYPGDTVIANINIGDSMNVQNNFYGAAFTITYDKTKVQSGSEQFYFNNSWLGIINQSQIKIDKLNTSAGTISVGLARITNTDTSGYGKVATFKFILKSPLYGTTLNITTNNGIKINHNGVRNTLNTGLNSVAVVHGTASIEQQKITNKTSIYPNPSNGNINITSASNIEELKVTNTLGQIVYEAKPQQQKVNLQLNAAGIYFISTTVGKESSTQKVIVQP